MGDEDVSGGFRRELDHDVEDFYSSLKRMNQLFNDHLQSYLNSMQKSFDENSAYFKATQLAELHEMKKGTAISQVRMLFIAIKL